MATEPLVEQQNETELPQEAPEEKRKFRFASKNVKILLLLVLVMAVEAGGMFLLLPGPAGGTSSDEEGGLVQKDAETVEVTIDTFSLSNPNAAPGHNIYVEFKLTAVVAENQATAFDLAANKKHKEEVRQAVDWVIGNSSLIELNDPRKTVIRRKIKEEINKVLGTSYVNRVILTGFQHREQ